MEPVLFPLRVELPRGQHAMLRDPEDVPERLRRPYLDASERLLGFLAEAGVTDADIAAARGGDQDRMAAIGVKAVTGGARMIQRGVQDSLIAALVESWSYDKPVSAEAVQDLPGRAYDALCEACEPLAAALNPDFTPNPDPESPTQPSSG